MPTEAIVRGDFFYAYGRFYANPGQVERVQGSVLRAAFLPELTPAGQEYLSTPRYLGGQTYLRHNYEDWFVRCQLKHYGVPFNEADIAGNGTLLLQKALEAGRCDQVPAHIAQQRDEMHAEWIQQLTLEETSKKMQGHPEWVMERCFLTSGQPDRTKTTTVIGMPFDVDDSDRYGAMREAVSRIPGLHQVTCNVPGEQTIFVGWDSAAVKQAAKRHKDEYKKAIEAWYEEREQARSKLHDGYLKTIERKQGSEGFSPVGDYVVDCEEIEARWPDQDDDFSLSITKTGKAGIYLASFDFGVVEGVMIMGVDAEAVEDYCERYDEFDEDEMDEMDEMGLEDEYSSEDDYSSEDENSSEDEGEPRLKVCTASIARTHGRGHTLQEAKTSATQPLKYHLKLRCADKMNEGQIYYEPQNGAIEYHQDNMASFTGEVSLPGVGSSVWFIARKTSDTVSNQFPEPWAEYSKTAYENAQDTLYVKRASELRTGHGYI
ncbi:hypothetical protein F4777DRAFT_566514 [Nemania sp. FL0916]|nr:hypothetical protein F4777DRAFT_566514 [Nemania sp. FL0916]